MLNNRTKLATLALMAMTLVGTTVPTFAWTARFCSGENLAIGLQDSNIGTLKGPGQTAGFTTLTATDFAAAQSGPKAWTVATYPGWAPATNIASDCQWVNLNQSAGASSTALYAHTFMWNSSSTSANLSVKFLVDDQMGDVGGLDGMYMNGNPIANSTGGAYNSVTTWNFNNVSMLANQLNTMYFYARNLGSSASGVAYCVEADAVPEPCTMLSACGFAIGAIMRRKMKKA